MKRSLKLLPLAAAAILLSSTGSASAAAYGYSYDNIFGLAITPTGSATFADTTNISRSTATLNGVSIINGSTGILDSPQAALGAVTRGENNFTQQGQGPTSFSRGDAQIVSTQNPPFPAGSTTTQSVNAAESFVAGAGSADASGRNGSNTGFTINFVVGAPGASIGFAFSASPFMQVFLSAMSGAGSSATANLVEVFTITDALGTTVFNWAPDGNVGSGIMGGTESADGADLNINLSTNTLTAGAIFSYDPLGCGTPGGTGISTACGADFAASTANLVAGNYTLSLNAVESTDLIVSQQVPEPGTLALLGLGLAGLCVGARRTSTDAGQAS
jgi:hypothetical protein